MFGEKREEASIKAPPNVSQSLLLQASRNYVVAVCNAWISVPVIAWDNHLSNDLEFLLPIPVCYMADRAKRVPPCRRYVK